MADPEPRALRLYVLLATALVVIGGATGYLVWWTTHPSSGLGAEEVDVDLSKVVLRPVDFLPGTTAADREKITRLIDQAILSNPTPQFTTRADEELTSMGESAAARLVDAFHTLSQGEGGFTTDLARRRGGAIERILVRIRRRLPPAAFPQQGRGVDDPAAAMERRAKVWLVWWDSLQSRPGVGR